jgi:ABC-type transport system involved in cytochrome c biogenesis ATPase subunit
VPRLALVFTGAALLVVLYAAPGGIGQVLEGIRDRVVRRLAARRGLDLVESNACGAVETVGTVGTCGSPPAAGEPALRVQGLTAAYGSLQVLFGVDLDVAEGEMVALLGTNGAGKSTLLRAVAGLVPATGGTVELAGANVAGVPTDRIAAMGFALMPGGRGVFPTLTVEENLRLATWQLRSEPTAAATAREDMLDLFPGLRDRLGVMAGNLSSGEQQMLSLAMAFVASAGLGVRRAGGARARVGHRQGDTGRGALPPPGGQVLPGRRRDRLFGGHPRTPGDPAVGPAGPRPGRGRAPCLMSPMTDAPHD